MRTTPAVLFFLLIAAPLAAQEVPDTALQAPAPNPLPTPTAPAPPGGEQLVDRVVAVVGDTVLLLSEVQTDLQQLEAAGQPLPADPSARAAIAREIVDRRVQELILVEAARAAGLEIQDQEITRLVEQDLEQVQQRFGSEEAFRTALAGSGLTLEQYRETLADQYRARTLRDRMLQQRLAGAPRPPVSEEQIRAVFEQQRAALGERPANLSFSQLIIEPQPSDSARAAARREAEQVQAELVAGGDFEVLAKRYSDDPGSREQGGNLGWFRRGRMVPQFENVAFAMRPGQTSPIVETEFGFHIIRVDKARGNERQARHILIRPELTEADRVRARERADSVAAAVHAGTPIETLARTYPLPQGEQPSVDRVPTDRLQEISPAYATAFQNAAAGAVVGPFEIEGPSGPRWVIARVRDRQEAGAYSLDDVREQIRTRLQEQLLVERLTEELRRGMHVSIML